MYSLPYHKARDVKDTGAFVREHPFAFLMGCDAQSNPIATQVPVFMEKRRGRTLLRGHLMRGTDHHEAFLQNENVLVVFTGSHVYVSGRRYEDPHTPSTWNYMSVHASGTIRFLDAAALEEMLRELSLHFEDGDAASPTTYDNLPPDLRAKRIKQVVAFEITVTDLDTVFKSSQDRDRTSYLNIIKELKSRGEAGAVIAAEMESRIADVFPENG